MLSACFFVEIGGDGGARTHDLCVANASLSQLSYAPLTCAYFTTPTDSCIYFFIIDESYLTNPFFRICIPYP